MDAVTVLTRLGLTLYESQLILSKAVRTDLPSSTVVLSSGNRSDNLYLIIEGQVKWFAFDPNGSEVIISHHGAGEYFGGMGFDEEPLSASVMTVKPSRFLVLPKSELKVILPKSCPFKTRLFERLLHELEEVGCNLTEAQQHKTAISDILRSMARSPFNVQTLLETVAENAARLCDATNADILQVEGDDLQLVAKYGLSNWWPIGAKRRINRNWVTGRAVVDCIPVHVNDLQAAEAEFPEGSVIAKQHGHRTTFAAPMLREGSAIGAILIRRREVRPLSDKQIALIMTFADQAAIVFENVRLMNVVQEKNRHLEDQSRELSEWNSTLEIRVAEQVARLEQLAKLEHELSLASDIQKSMLPRSIPRFEGFEFCARMIPAKSVGGDFFDFISLGKDSLAIAIGDVADKGVPAALFMAMVRSLLRAETHRGNSPREVLQRVNRHILGMNDKGMFVTVLLGMLNRQTREFAYARAGHEPPIFFNDNGLIQRQPMANGQALGLFDEVTIDEQTIQLTKNSVLLLFTDGIPDATNPQGMRFGKNSMTRTVSHLLQMSAANVCSEIIRKVIKHQENSHQFDDMTVIVVRAI